MSPTQEMRRWRILTLAWCLLMCVAFGLIVAGATYYYVQRTSDRLEGARKHSDQQFSKALIVTDRKFRQALRVSTVQGAYSINRSVCGFISIADDAIARSKKALADPTANEGAKARNRQAILDAQTFRNTQVPVPSDFDCSTLPEKPPKP